MEGVHTRRKKYETIQKKYVNIFNYYIINLTINQPCDESTTGHQYICLSFPISKYEQLYSDGLVRQ